jgi:hypothetical protein
MAAEILPYVVAALADEGHGAYEHLGALETLCVTLPYADPDVLIAVDKVDCLATRLPAMVSATGADQGDMPVLASWPRKLSPVSSSTCHNGLRTSPSTAPSRRYATA